MDYGKNGDVMDYRQDGGVADMGDNWGFTDAHTHIGTWEEQREREETGILSLVCGSTPREAERAVKMRGRYVIPTCGLHPWYGAEYQVEELTEWMEQCPVIGEIGMDSVWCQTPLKIQEQVFRRQLRMAHQAGKPVILHTKGQEERISGIIKEFPNRYLVHWYSCGRYPEEFLAQDCYFSIGPDVWWNPAVQQIAANVPADRLLVETDGLNSVKWAWEEGLKALGAEKAECGVKERQLAGEAEFVVKERRLAGETECIVKERRMAGERKCLGKGWAEDRKMSVMSALSHTLSTVAKLRRISYEEAGRRCWNNLVYGFLGSLFALDFFQKAPYN